MFLKLPPAKVLAVIIDRKGLASFILDSETPSPASNYGLSFSGRMPQEDQYDRWGSIADYGNTVGDRLMESGEYELKPRVQVRVRGTDYAEAYAKVTAIARYLLENGDGDGLLVYLPLRLEIGTERVQLKNDSLTNGPMFLGDEEKNERLSFSLNLQLTLLTEQ